MVRDMYKKTEINNNSWRVVSFKDKHGAKWFYIYEKGENFERLHLRAPAEVFEPDELQKYYGKNSEN